MTATTRQELPAGYSMFSHYAFPPNALGYCGPDNVAREDLGSHAREFDGAWPYLAAIAEAAGIADPLDPDVVRNYWVGGELLDLVDPAQLLGRLTNAFAGQLTGLLDRVTPDHRPLAHHSFHVLVVYPWVGFLDRDAATAVKIMQNCRIRWGTVDSVSSREVAVRSRPLRFDDGLLSLGDPQPETVRRCDDGAPADPAPSQGDVVSAHWDWVCSILPAAETEALADATQATLDLVNMLRRC